MTTKIQSILLDRLLPHPDNPNRMSEPTFRKLVRNIKQAGKYEPVVVRPHPQKEGFFQIINGRHRVKALQQLGLQKADCLVWDVDDRQTAILLATLNRLSGSDVLDKKLELIKKLKANFQTGELAKLLPYTKGQIEKLTNLKRPILPAKTGDISFAKPLVFFVTADQLQIIEQALSLAEDTNSKANRPVRRAAALTKITNRYVKNSPEF